MMPQQVIRAAAIGEKGISSSKVTLNSEKFKALVSIIAVSKSIGQSVTDKTKILLYF